MSEVVNVRQGQYLGELLAQPDFHLVLGGIDSILGETAGLDVTIEDDYLMTGLRNLLCREKSGWSRTNDEHRLHPWDSLTPPRCLGRLRKQGLL